MARKKHNEDKKLHNSEEKLHNSHELDLSWQETVDLLPEDEVEGGSEIYYFNDGDGNMNSREFFTIEIGDRQRWARSELKTINRLMKENERTLRRMGITLRDKRLSMIRKNYDTLPREKKKVVDEWIGLLSRRAKLKTRYGV